MFTCPGCSSKFRIAKASGSGRIKCPKCGLVSAWQAAPASPPAPPLPERTLPADIPSATTIGGHKILAYLGGSEYTATYKASQISMSRIVLFRALRPKYAGDPAIRAKFFADARVMARMNHPNLLSVFDMGEEGPACFYTTEFLEGGTLPEFLACQEKMSSAQRLAIATQIARALAYAEGAGVQQLWLRPEDVLLSEKGDVRMSRVGAGAPMEGGASEPVLSVLARLMHLAAAGKDLPQEARTPGTAGSVSMPMSRDALGSQLNALVVQLLAEGERAFPKVAAFAAELERLSESVQRRSTVSATTAPGGVVPLHLERAKRREFPAKALAIGVAIGLVALGLVSYWVYGYYTDKQAEKLWNQACQECENPKTLFDALETYQQLAARYPRTTHGGNAKTAIPNLRKKIVQDELQQILDKYENKPHEKDSAIVAINAARERLQLKLPEESSFVREKASICVQNINVRYDRGADEDWKNAVRLIDGYRGRMQYGDALKEGQGYIDRWSTSAAARKQYDRAVEWINQEAERKFDELMREVDNLVAAGQNLAAEDKLRQITRTFGIPKYVDKANERLKELQGQPKE